MSATDAASRLDTARTLLSHGLAGAHLEPAEPDPAVDEVDALAGFGALVSGRDVRLSVYVLDAWGLGHDREDALRARAEANHRLPAVAVNGYLLFVGTVGADSPPGDRFLLSDLCSAFAGRE